MFNLIVIYALIFILILPLLIVRSNALKYSIRFQRTIYYVNHILGWIIGINGPIRTGKTSLLSGLSSISQIIIINEIQDLLNRTIRIFKHIDFNRFNNYLLEVFQQNSCEYHDFEALTDYILDLHQLDGEKLHYTLVGNIKVRKLILDYIFSFYCLHVRNNFVQSKTPFYSNVTHSFSMDLQTKWLSIRDAYKD